MAAQTKFSGKKESLRMRRMRRFGFDDSILSNETVYLNPCTESSSQLSADDLAMYAVAARYFNEMDS